MPTDLSKTSPGSPARAAAWTFAIGSGPAAAALGVLGVVAEHTGYVQFGVDAQLRRAGYLAASVAVSAVVSGLLARAALSLRGGWATALLIALSFASAVIASYAIIFSDLEHRAPSLSPTAGALVALFLTPILVVSFLPVLRLARRAHAGDAGLSALDVSAAGYAWAAAVAMMGCALAPGPHLAITSALGLGCSVLGLYRTYARTRSRATLLGGMRTGLPRIALMALLIVPLRLHEQATTRNPAVIAIYRGGHAGRCEVRAAGRHEDVSLWLVDCGSVKGPMLGWDERAGVLLEGEELRARTAGAGPLAGRDPTEVGTSWPGR